MCAFTVNRFTYLNRVWLSFIITHYAIKSNISKLLVTNSKIKGMECERTRGQDQCGRCEQTAGFCKKVTVVLRL